MNFTRKRIKGQHAKTKRTWMDETGCYRITWSKTMCGVAVEKPYYHACVRAARTDGTEYWGFAGRRGPYKTLKAAKQACETNHKLWSQFCHIKRRSKVTQVRRLIANNFVGTGKAAVPIMSDLPAWVFAEADQRLIDIFYPNGKLKEDDECESQDDPGQTLKPSDSPALGLDCNAKGGHASDVEESGGATSPTLTAENAPTKTRAKRAKAQAKAPAKRSSRRTAKRSSGGKKKSARSASGTS